MSRWAMPICWKRQHRAANQMGVPPGAPILFTSLPKIRNHPISDAYVGNIGVAVLRHHLGFIAADASIEEDKSEHCGYQQGYWRPILKRPSKHHEEFAGIYGMP